MPAPLYLVGTPIGNLEDITLRALRILREEAVIIACEDTRQTQKLLNHFEIRKPTLSFHEHNEQSRTENLLQRLEAGETVALVSDAGMPLIADPGYKTVVAALARGIPVVAIPGPVAFVTALAASGLPIDKFCFAGFLPPKRFRRRKFLQEIRDFGMTTVVYETPHRILEALTDMAEILADQPLAVGRELTKLHEEFLRGTAAAVLQSLGSRPSIRGEFTVVIGAGAEEQASTEDPVALVDKLESEGLARMDAIKKAAKLSGVGKRELYRRLAVADEPAEDSSSLDKHHDSARKDQ